MIVTTSRKPSRKTRVFCRRLSAFFNFDCITRGKIPVAALDDAVVLGDQKGNPGSLRIYRDSTCRLSLFFSILSDENINIRYADLTPVVIGTSELSALFSELLDLDSLEKDESEDNKKIKRKMIVTDDCIEFMDSGKTVFVLKIIGYKTGKAVDIGY